MVTKFDYYVFHNDIPFLTRMMQNWTKTITTKNEDDIKIQKIQKKNTINGYVYVEKISSLIFLSIVYNVG